MSGHWNSAVVGLSLLGLTTLVGCEDCGGRPVPDAGVAPTSSAVAPVAPKPSQAGPYPPTKKVSLVGRLAATGGADDTCPPIDPAGKWRPRRLFVDSGEPTAAAPRGMERFCAYDWVDAEAPTKEAIEGARSGAAERFEAAFPLERDVQNVSSAGFRYIDVGYSAEALDRFQAAVGVPAPSAVAALALPASHVRVALIDTFPNWAEPSELPLPTTASLGAAHGYGLASIVKTLACGGAANCATQVSTHLALPDGYYGTKADLAAAINSAVSGWKADAARPEKLIIHLAVGWEPQVSPRGAASADPCGVTPGSASRGADSGAVVLRAIRRAACSGALVIAAAGNNQGPLMNAEGPICPAAFETLPEPTSAECGEWAAPKAKVPPESGGGYAPLVHAVGAIGYDGAPLVSARKDGMPKTSAHGEQGVGLALPGWAAPRGMSGSSVATSVAAAVASLVWAKNPSWKPADVMKKLYESGLPVPETGAPLLSSFFLTGSARAPVQRVQLCRALGLDSACPPAPLVKIVPLASGGSPDPVPLHHGIVTLVKVTPSTAPGYLVVPQPITVCPECVLGLPVPPEALADIFGTIRSLPSGQAITDTRLQVSYGSLPAETYHIELPELHVGDSFEASVALSGSAVQAAQLTWTLTPSGRPVTQQIMIGK